MKNFGLTALFILAAALTGCDSNNSAQESTDQSIEATVRKSYHRRQAHQAVPGGAAHHRSAHV